MSKSQNPKNPTIHKTKIAIFDFTDCEGCEVEILSLKEKLLAVAHAVDIVNCRLASSVTKPGPYDVSFVEGAVMTSNDVNRLEEIRKQSKFLVAVGSCACFGGVQAIVKEKDRAKFTKAVYNKDYQPLSFDAKPLSSIVKVDVLLRGCPIDQKELERVISQLIVGRLPKDRFYPVCLECKLNENHCLFLDGEPCLGPVTIGGCGAICPTNKVRCYGCFGTIDQPNVKTMFNILAEEFGEEEAKRQIEVFNQINLDNSNK